MGAFSSFGSDIISKLIFVPAGRAEDVAKEIGPAWVCTTVWPVADVADTTPLIGCPTSKGAVVDDGKLGVPEVAVGGCRDVTRTLKALPAGMLTVPEGFAAPDFAALFAPP